MIRHKDNDKKIFGPVLDTLIDLLLQLYYKKKDNFFG